MDFTQAQQQAAIYIAQERYHEAIALYEQCIDANPSLMDNYWHLGLAWLLLGEESEAQAIWLSAMTQGTPAEMDVRMAQLVAVLETEARRYLYDHKLQLAIDIYWQLLELDSNQAEVYYNLGNAIAQQGNYDEAIACWQKAIELKPDFAQAYQDQGSIFQKLEEFGQAIVCYSKALEIKPDWIEVLYNLGLCFFHLGRLDEAITCFKTAIQLNPDFAQARGDLGYALLKQGKLDEAITCFKTAIQLNPSFTQAYCQFIDSVTEQGRANTLITAKAGLLKALQYQQNSSDLYSYLGEVLVSKNEFNLAITAYKKAIALQPDSAELYLSLGKALARIGNVEEAIASYQRAISLQPNCAELYLNLGKVLVGKGDVEEAIASYQKALNLNPECSEAYCYLGNALSVVGAWDEAIAYYQKTLELQTNSIEAYCNLGVALAQRNKSDEAIACFKNVMDINPDLAKAINEILIILCEQGLLDKESRYFQKILPVNSPNDFYESTWDWIVTSNLDTNNYINIYPKTIIPLKQPNTLDKSIHFSFRFGTQVPLPASFVAIVPNGRYWLNKEQSTSAVITPNNQLLGDVSPEFPILSPGHPDKHPSKSSIFSLEKLPPVQNIDGTVVVISGLFNNVYFHWMFDVLPRIELLYQSGIEIASIDKLLISNKLSFQKESLQALGIPETKILETDNYSHIRATKLVVPSFPGTVAWMPKWACDFLRSTFLNLKTIEPSEKIERIYISRKEASCRRFINEVEVISLLEKFGFQSVTLESMSVVKQASLLANAKVVVAPHGGGLTNIVFCRPGTKVIDIFSPYYVYPCYWLISNLVGLDYYYLLGETLPGYSLHKLICPNQWLEDIFVNLDKLFNLMKFAGVI